MTLSNKKIKIFQLSPRQEATELKSMEKQLSTQNKETLKTSELLLLQINLGDTRTIVTHPASTTHSKLTEEERLAVSITDGLVRVSVGLETLIDVINDLNQALT